MGFFRMSLFRNFDITHWASSVPKTFTVSFTKKSLRKLGRRYAHLE